MRAMRDVSVLHAELLLHAAAVWADCDVMRICISNFFRYVFLFFLSFSFAVVEELAECMAVGTVKRSVEAELVGVEGPSLFEGLWGAVFWKSWEMVDELLEVVGGRVWSDGNCCPVGAVFGLLVEGMN